MFPINTGLICPLYMNLFKAQKQAHIAEPFINRYRNHSYMYTFLEDGFLGPCFHLTTEWLADLIPLQPYFTEAMGFYILHQL